MNTSEICNDEQRRHAVRAKPELNGLDYLEVGEDYRTLTVYFLGKAPQELLRKEGEPIDSYKRRLRQFVRIEGGRRIRDVKVEDVEVRQATDPKTGIVDPERDDEMIVQVDRDGDFSTYTLRLVGLENIDPRYDHVTFSFKADCPSDLDCAPAEVCPPAPRVEPEINYLAKDYASFRQLILDRLALIMPDWKERHVPDLGIALVELLAYAGDHLSYYQDAVATEAYLDTARQRISVRRHARLVDYAMHEGCNARAWLCAETDSDLELDPADIYFITGYNDALPVTGNALTADDVRNVSIHDYEVFEPMQKEAIRPYAAHNEIHFYTWGDRECCLPRGATRATLLDVKGDIVIQHEAEKRESYEQTAQKQQPEKTIYPPPEPARILHLQVGDILIFEEVIGPETGNPADADPTHRHAVRLTKVTPGEDTLYDPPIPIVEIEWAAEDALPFALCLSAIGPAPECAYLEDISIARGNVILVDHGWTIEPPEPLGMVPLEATESECECEGHSGDVRYVPGRLQPHLQKSPLTFSQPLPPADTPAARLLSQDPRQAYPQVWLTGTRVTPQGESVTPWVAKPDLLSSQPDDYHFVVEMDNDWRAYLRFGDGELGRMPEAGTTFTATYRVGSGTRGNVGAETILRIVTRRTKLSGGIVRVRNPLPARSGVDPEPLAEVKLFAPHAFRKRLERAITAGDYARLAERNSKVQRAAAALRWTGNWYEAQVAIDPSGVEEASETLLRQIEGYLYPYRRIAHDLAVLAAQRVSLDIEVIVCVLPHYLRGHVKAALLDVFSNRRLPDGRLGFFHADNLTFGEGIYLSKLVAAAQAVPGVESVKVAKLERLYEGPNREIENGVLRLGPLEVARLDNDPSFPEHGRLVLDVKGGR